MSEKPTLAIVFIAVATSFGGSPYRKPAGPWRGSRVLQQPGIRRGLCPKGRERTDVTSITMQIFH
jgi:hypothetical protein